MENTRRTWLTGLTTQGSRGFTETEAPSTGPEWFCTRSSAHILSLLAWCFLELLPVGVGISLTFLPALGIFSSYWVSFSGLGVRVFSLSSSVLFCPFWLLCCGWKPALFRREMKGQWMWEIEKVQGSR